MMDHLTAYRQRYPSRFYRSGMARPGFPLFPDDQGGVCTKAGVTNTIRKVAKHSGQQVVDPGGLLLPS